jgi:hypothetical protein
LAKKEVKNTPAPYVGKEALKSCDPERFNSKNMAQLYAEELLRFLIFGLSSRLPTFFYNLGYSSIPTSCLFVATFYSSFVCWFMSGLLSKFSGKTAVLEVHARVKIK